MSERRLRIALGVAGALLLAALAGVALFSDLLGDAARLAAELQIRLNRDLARELRGVRDAGLTAMWSLVAIGFTYGVLHTLGPGHGKAVVVAYFLDPGRRMGWLDGIFAGTWIAITHTVSAIVMVGVLYLVTRPTPLRVIGDVRSIELVSYALITAIGLFRLWAGLTGRLHHHHHGHGHGHGHVHGGHGDHGPVHDHGRGGQGAHGHAHDHAHGDHDPAHDHAHGEDRHHGHASGPVRGDHGHAHDEDRHHDHASDHAHAARRHAHDGDHGGYGPHGQARESAHGDRRPGSGDAPAPGHPHDHARGHRRTEAAAPGRLRRFLALDSGLGLLTAAGIAPCAGAVVLMLLASALGVIWAGVVGVMAIALGMAITLAAVGIASMLAHRLLLGERQSNVIGRLVTIAAALVVVGTGGFMLAGALYRLFSP